MKRAGFAMAGLLWAAGCASSPQAPPPPSTPPVRVEPMASDGTPCITDRAALMAMDYWTFDQDPAGARSVLQKPGCEIAGADLIRDYHAALRAKGEPVTHIFEQGTVTFSETGEVPLLYWHEGQARAFEGETETAIGLFRKSIEPENQNAGGWNQYVLATIAFLEGDRSTLEAQREALAARVQQGNLNLGVVDGLIACFGKPYADAYGTAECDRRPAYRPDPPA